MDWGAALVASVVGVPSVLVAVLGYRRSTRIDAVAAQFTAGTDSRAGIQQIIDGQNQLIDNLQTDNESLRETLRDQATRIAEAEIGVRENRERAYLLQSRFEVVERERDELQRALDRMIAEHGA